MARKKKTLRNVTITGIADRGKSVGRTPEGIVAFVDNVVPGDVVDVLVTKKRKGVAFGRPIAFHSYSADRIDPTCSHFGVCGGCKWQHLSYPAQLKHKQQNVLDAFTRIAKIADPPLLDIIGSKEQLLYRNKLEYTFSNKRWLTEEEVASGASFEQRNALGFHRPGAFDKIVDVETCHLQKEPTNLIRNFIRAYCLEHSISFFDIRSQVGMMRNLIIKTTTTGDVMVIVVFYENDHPTIKALLNSLINEFPNITSLYYVVNAKKNDTLYDQDLILYKGNPQIVQSLGATKFQIGPKSFFQTNPLQAKTLYDVAVEFAGLKGSEIVYDLYTGLGSIALYVAGNCKQVIGIEEVEAAIEDAKSNKEFNAITNATFYAGRVKDILTDEFISENGKPDLIITDPPRAGMHTAVIAQLLELNAPKIVYISCNPSTQARDVQLMESQYKVEKLQPVDMFPHTHHIENVALLIRK